MNLSMIVYFLGWILKIEGAFLLLPCIVSLIYQETSGFYILGTSVFCLIMGQLLSRRLPSNRTFYAKEGFVAVALGWIALSFFGCMPFFLSGQIPALEDALFETISGFTTTGSSILRDVEALDHGMLMWRSLTHWIGGMGVLVFMLAILPMAEGNNIHLMRAESPGPSVGKLVPKVRSTAKILYGIYFFMTVIMVVCLLASGMHWFDALCMAVGTAGTGGFGVLGDSVASYTTMQQTILTIFMLLFGVNFNAYYLILIRKYKDALRMEEVLTYFGIVAISTLLITLNIRGDFSSLYQAFHHAAFQVATIVTTTGFASVDFDLWPTFSKIILVLLMFSGGCAGSTSGGMKVSRLGIAAKTVKKEMSSLIHPRRVKILKYEGKPIEHSVLRSINTYFIAYFMIFAVSLLLISLDGFDFTTSFTSVLTTLGNVGPGLAAVGPTCSFADYSVASKLVLMFNMLAGRLEIFPLLLLFFPGTWKRNV